MNRKDQLLALKTLQSREVKETDREKLSQRSTQLFGTRKKKAPPPRLPQRAPAPDSTVILATELSQRAVTPKTYFRKRQAELRNSIVENKGVSGISSEDNVTKMSTMKPIKNPSKTFQATAELSLNQETRIPQSSRIPTPQAPVYELAIDLSEKSLTPRTNFRKLQARIKKKINEDLSTAPIDLPSTSLW